MVHWSGSGSAFFQALARTTPEPSEARSTRAFRRYHSLADHLKGGAGRGRPRMEPLRPWRFASNARAEGGASASATSLPAALKLAFIAERTRAVGGTYEAHLTDFTSLTSSTRRPLASSLRTR